MKTQDTFVNPSGHLMYRKTLPLAEGVSESYEKANIDTYLTQEEEQEEKDKFEDIYPRNNHLQEQRRADNTCELIFHTVHCYQLKNKHSK